MADFGSRLSLVDDVSSADWLRARVDEFGVGGSGVPPGFGSYVQVLHPGSPADGEIPDALLDLLNPVLARHTASEHGWFCLWEGWGFLTGSTTRLVAWHVDHQPPPGTPNSFRSQPAFPPEVRKGPKVRLPYRNYFLFEGPLDAAGDLGAWITWQPGGAREYQRHTPSLWWPDDHAWCAGNDIDARFTCIGGPRALSDELLRHPALEVLELDPSEA